MRRLTAEAVQVLGSVLRTPRDRILSAWSDDGLRWHPDRGVRINIGKTPLVIDMAYTCHVSHIDRPENQFEMLFQASEEGNNKWNSRILKAISSDGLKWDIDRIPVITTEFDPLCAKRVIAPYIVDWGTYLRMYFIGVADDGVHRVLSAVSTDRRIWSMERGARLEPCNDLNHNGNDLTGILDACVLPLGNGQYRMYFTAQKQSVYQQDIRSATSRDGLNWEMESGIRISPDGKGYSRWANNPHVMRHGKGLRMYFRGSDQPPLWSNIYTAYSEDGLDWNVEGVALRFRRHACYERHGVAFPFVLLLPNGKYRMYYTGYWGNWLDKPSVEYYQNIHRSSK